MYSFSYARCRDGYQRLSLLAVESCLRAADLPRLLRMKISPNKMATGTNTRTNTIPLKLSSTAQPVNVESADNSAKPNKNARNSPVLLSDSGPSSPRERRKTRRRPMRIARTEHSAENETTQKNRGNNFLSASRVVGFTTNSSSSRKATHRASCASSAARGMPSRYSPRRSTTTK